MLAGGPRDLPTESRVQRVASLADMVKLPFGSGYEPDRSRDVPMFQWVGRTTIAE